MQYIPPIIPHFGVSIRLGGVSQNASKRREILLNEWRNVHSRIGVVKFEAQILLEEKKKTNRVLSHRSEIKTKRAPRRVFVDLTRSLEFAHST